MVGGRTGYTYDERSSSFRSSLTSSASDSACCSAAASWGEPATGYIIKPRWQLSHRSISTAGSLGSSFCSLFHFRALLPLAHPQAPPPILLRRPVPPLCSVPRTTTSQRCPSTRADGWCARTDCGHVSHCWPIWPAGLVRRGTLHMALLGAAPSSVTRNSGGPFSTLFVRLHAGDFRRRAAIGRAAKRQRSDRGHMRPWSEARTSPRLTTPPLLRLLRLLHLLHHRLRRPSHHRPFRHPRLPPTLVLYLLCCHLS